MHTPSVPHCQLQASPNSQVTLGLTANRNMEQLGAVHIMITKPQFLKQ
jgi:hypothetical protein